MYCSYPSIYDNHISLKDIDLRIPLKLNGILSYFNSRRSLPSEIYDTDEVFITLNKSECNPHRPSYSYDESVMPNYVGDIVNTRVHKMYKELTLIQIRYFN